jgi:polyisoprenyl-phosphate glycosyltransferase
MYVLRRMFYALINRLSDVELVQNATGFGLYDKTFVDILRTLDEPYPYYRGLIAELGLTPALIPYRQPARQRGLTKNNWYTLYDLAMLGITSHSKVPLRLATMVGFSLSILSFAVAMAYLVYKLVFWDRFTAGVAPLVIGAFFLFSVQLFFLGLLGEYIAVIHTRVMKRPLVVEKERVNFN